MFVTGYDFEEYTFWFLEKDNGLRLLFACIKKKKNMSEQFKNMFLSF